MQAGSCFNLRRVNNLGLNKPQGFPNSHISRWHQSESLFGKKCNVNKNLCRNGSIYQRFLVNHPNGIFVPGGRDKYSQLLAPEEWFFKELPMERESIHHLSQVGYVNSVHIESGGIEKSKVVIGIYCTCKYHRQLLLNSFNTAPNWCSTSHNFCSLPT